LKKGGVLYDLKSLWTQKDFGTDVTYMSL
jgi:hypothetical protein